MLSIGLFLHLHFAFYSRKTYCTTYTVRVCIIILSVFYTVNVGVAWTAQVIGATAVDFL